MWLLPTPSLAASTVTPANWMLSRNVSNEKCTERPSVHILLTHGEETMIPFGAHDYDTSRAQGAGSPWVRFFVKLAALLFF